MSAEYKNQLESFMACLSDKNVPDERIEFAFESIRDWSQKGSYEELWEWYWERVNNCAMVIQKIPLTECEGWKIDSNGSSFVHESGEFFLVEGYRVTCTGQRENRNGWDQPFLTQVGFDGGILGMIRGRFEGVPHYLVQAKQEPGNYNIVQVSTTLQATFSNLNKAHKGRAPYFSEYFLGSQKSVVSVIWEQWTSEDGGRLFNKRNKSILVEISQGLDLNLPSEDFRWVSLYQLKKLIREENAVVSPHVRGIISAL